MIFLLDSNLVGSPLLCVIGHAYEFMESFFSNTFAVRLSVLVITITPFSTQLRAEPRSFIPCKECSQFYLL
jgi:hypothetical protein